MPNRLAIETSLYLKQHAHNPVDWFPWGPDALARAKELNRPIFLSIGYSACHWCHVMERESFESEATAALLNAHFVSIKVDREERPDLDAIYMTALQVMNDEGGGWPLSAFLTPEGTPFYAGTYFPPDDRYAPHRPSFNKLLTAIHEAWTHRREQALEVGQNVTAKLRELSAATASDNPVSAEPLFGALNVLREAFDANHGGFGTAPKFPHALELRTFVNGKLVQKGNTGDMIRRLPELIEYLSSFMTLSPGDLILTGTPDGIVNVNVGDEVVTEIADIGRLVNTIVGDWTAQE